MGELRSVHTAAREILEGGPSALAPLPEPASLVGRPRKARRQVLDRLRPELYGVCCLLADAAVGAALEARPAFPPYGLARSLYSQMRMVTMEPRPYGPGSIQTFRELGMAYQDTMVYHLHRHLAGTHSSSGDAWLVHRLEDLLALFRAGADPSGQARMRDAVSFLYGGLQFGVSVCVQLVEVMRTVVLDGRDLPPEEVAAALSRSVRPAHRLAALNVDEVVGAYQLLHTPEPAAPGWMQPSRFAAREGPEGWRVDLADPPPPPVADGQAASYSTLGCPARVSPSSGRPAIVELWAWCVDLSGQLGLLGRSARAG